MHASESPLFEASSTAVPKRYVAIAPMSNVWLVSDFSVGVMPILTHKADAMIPVK